MKKVGVESILIDCIRIFTAFRLRRHAECRCLAFLPQAITFKKPFFSRHATTIFTPKQPCVMHFFDQEIYINQHDPGGLRSTLWYK